MAQYVEGDQSSNRLTFHADGSSTGFTSYYRIQNGQYVRIETTIQQNVTLPSQFQQEIVKAKTSLNTGVVEPSYSLYPQADGKYSLPFIYMEALRYAVASGSNTMAQAEALLRGKCLAQVSPSDFVDPLPDTLPLSVGANFFYGSSVDAMEWMNKTIGSVDDRALMATLSQGSSMPWSIGAGKTAASAAVEDWSGTMPTIYAAGGAVDTATGTKIANTIAQGVTGATQTTLIDNSWKTHAHVDSAEQVYLAYFGRPADIAGIRTTEDQITAAGGDKAAITSMFANSSESAAFYAGKTTEQKVDTVYNQLFNRAAEKAGLDYWVNQLNLGLINQVNMCIKILDGAQNSDKTIVNNRVTVAKYFTEKISSSAYDGLNAASGGRELLSSIGADAGDVTKAKAVIDSAGYSTDLKSGDVTDDITLVGLSISPYFHG